MAKRRIEISESTIERRLVEFGLHNLKPKRVPTLTEGNKLDRELWGDAHVGKCWNNTIILD